ncbi:MAG: fibronectin type III domain-containing protein [Candidatus Schekmanbacteria bacterium]|nr:fibronectin type III domain-containing protein [Candidatus Schekmanbacteria bacterium]
MAAGLTSLEDFRFQVQAGDAAGNWSTEGPTLTVRTEPEDREPPSLLSSTLEVVEVTGTTARLRWGPATDDVRVTKYVVGSRIRFLAETDGSTLEATVTGLRPGRRYEAELIAFDRAGNASSERPTAAFMAIDPGVPAPPEFVHVGPSDPFKGIEDELHPTWSVSPAAVRYRLYRRWPGERTPILIDEVLPEIAFTDRGLDPAQTYYYSVSAVDDRGVEGPRSVEGAGIPEEARLEVQAPRKFPPEVRLSFSRIVQGEDPREELGRNEYEIHTAPDGLPLDLFFTEPSREEWYNELEAIGLRITDRGRESATVVYDYDRFVEQIEAVAALPFVRGHLLLPTGYTPGSTSRAEPGAAISTAEIRELTGIEPLRKAGIDGSSIRIGLIDKDLTPGSHGDTAIAVI